MVLFLGGGCYALAAYLNAPLTTMRRQTSIAVGYVIAAVASVAFGKYFVVSMGMMGASLIYFTINAILVIAYLIVLFAGMHRIKTRQGPGRDFIFPV